MKINKKYKGFDVEAIRNDFPILHTKVYEKPLIYFDNASTSQKPKVVINGIKRYYSSYNSNIHRGVHFLSQESTDQFEKTRTKIKEYINASFSEEIIFTKGTTDAINTIAYSFGELISKEDEIIISEMEHHSNIVPWQMLCKRIGCKLKIIPINNNGELILSEFNNLLNKKTKLVSVSHISNTLGTINPIKYIIDSAHKIGAKVLIDGAQSLQHMKIDVKKLDCDFYVFSGHKIFGPTGIGVLYGKKNLLNQMPPYQGGGDMIEKVSFKKTTYNTLPHKFEAGTPNISGTIGLGFAVDYLNKINLNKSEYYENELTTYATKELKKIKDIRIIGEAKKKSSVISFVINNIHPSDIGTLLDKQGIAVRTGHHCTQPLMDYFKIPGTIRVSFAFYNTKKEIDSFILALKKSIKILA
ncbi:MAG: cysteine desulfurase CsdA [Crocinitomicaceae bacterium]|nr:cysteine desulfurase CsdA [Crocinitomicaceae bacterium]|tara:strand:- start:93950 stop:95188 length:1239 start_codon:yes stop_codon:yes gene_type:complete